MIEGGTKTSGLVSSSRDGKTFGERVLEARSGQPGNDKEKIADA